MKIVGIICEYNPFHLGHLYQINKIKELYHDSTIIALISPSITQRGDFSILNKWDKTSIVLNYGIDMVVELPSVYSFQSADIFALGAIKILNFLKIDVLVFGTETDDINKLTNAANIQNSDIFNDLCKKYLSKGYNYPSSLNQATIDILGYNISNPNDLLALSYIKAINSINSDILYINIKRHNSYHGNEIINNITSATNIRRYWHDKLDISSFIPHYDTRFLYLINEKVYFNFLKFQIYNNFDNLDKFLDVDEGIENRIKNFIDKSNSIEELINNIKTKRYTYNKIQRMLCHIVFNYTKKFNRDIDVDYIRVLGFNEKGCIHLHNIKKYLSIPIIFSYKKNISKLLDYEIYVTKIYSLVVGDNLLFKEYNGKPIIKK